MQTGGGITRKRRRMQRLLYWVMALLGAYILGKGGGFVLGRPAVQEAMAALRNTVAEHAPGVTRL